MEKQLITHSLLKDFRACKKRYYFRYELQRVPLTESEPLFFGSMMHELIEIWLKTGHDLEACLLHIEELETGDLFLKAKLEVMIRGYHEVYNKENYMAVEIEKEYRAPLVNPDTMGTSKTFEIGGKLDAIYKDLTTQRILMKETKTTSDDVGIESDYWKKLLIDGQVSGYFLGAEALGYKVESCLYDVIRKPMIRPLKATPTENIKLKKDGTPYAGTRTADETPDEFRARLEEDVAANLSKYFARKEVPRTEDDLRTYLQDVWDEAQTLLSKQNKQNFARNPEACITPFGTCPYWGVCSGQSAIEDPNQFQDSKKHRELEKVA
jgi:hypothetical protein